MKKFLLSLCLFFLPLMANAPRIFVDNDKNLAIEGYDAVTYFENANPQIGLRAYEVEWQGANWRFISGENKRRFEKTPERFAPQYGGYCPTGLSKGRLSGGLPTIWNIYQGKLYLLCSHQSLQEWREQPAKIKKMADQNWSRFVEENQ
jgi:YHS domain-containing protein